MSYDDVDALAAFARANDIPYPLLSDAGSDVIRRYGILNTWLEPNEAPFYGVAFPGTYTVDGTGTVTARLFARHYALRESPEAILEAALGRAISEPDAPCSVADEGEIRISARLVGGGGSIKSGLRRQIVVQLELPPGLHVYGPEVPGPTVATSIEIEGPDGMVAEAPLYPPTHRLRIDGETEVDVWSESARIVVPFWVNSRFHKAVGDRGTTILGVRVRYQACSADACLPPRTETLALEVPVEALDVPNLPMLAGSGGRATTMDSAHYITRLLSRFRRDS